MPATPVLGRHGQEEDYKFKASLVSSWSNEEVPSKPGLHNIIFLQNKQSKNKAKNKQKKINKNPPKQKRPFKNLTK